MRAYLTVALTMAGMAVFAEGTGLTPQQKSEALQRIAQVDRGRFLIQGSVVDDDGRPLNGVGVLVTKTKGGGPFEDARSENERLTVNGTFRLEYRDCISVQLRFTLDGYYPSVLLLEYDEIALDDKHVLGNTPIPTPVVEKNELRIVLEKRGNLTQLREFDEVLEYKADGSGVALDLEKSNRRHQSLVKVKNLHDPAQVPTNGIYMLAERDEQGRIAVVRKARPNSSVVDVLPRRLTLGMTMPDGGLVPLSLNAERSISSQTKAALEDGYAREISILPDDFVERGAHGGLVFNFRSGSKYGKGSTGWVKVSSDQSRVQLCLVLFQQPDGSRNVETEPHPHEVLTIKKLTAQLQDTVPPTISLLGASPVTIECGGVYADAGATATDDKDGNITARIVVENNVDTPKAGTYQVVYRVSDAAGNAATATRTVKVVYKFDGFLAPIGGADATGGNYANPVRTFKLGSTIPVKFKISCGGAAVKEGAHTLQVIKYNNETTAAEPIDATPTDAATTGNQFKLSGDEWHFNLDTKATGMSVGTWQLKATLSDGSTHLVWIALK